MLLYLPLKKNTSWPYLPARWYSLCNKTLPKNCPVFSSHSLLCPLHWKCSFQGSQWPLCCQMKWSTFSSYLTWFTDSFWQGWLPLLCSFSLSFAGSSSSPLPVTLEYPRTLQYLHSPTTYVILPTFAALNTMYKSMTSTFVLQIGPNFQTSDSYSQLCTSYPQWDV